MIAGDAIGDDILRVSAYGKRVHKMKRILLVALFLFLGMSYVGIKAGDSKYAFSTISPAYAQNDWKGEFHDLCSKTQDAMGFTEGELKELIAKCDGLKPVIEKLDETQRKVYLKRLRMCRDMFSFVLESKTKK